MAARDLYINLRPSTTQGAFVQSTKNLTAYTFTKFFREEKVSLNIYFLTPTPSAGVGSPASIETGISAYDCRIGIGTPGGTILASTSLTWDTDHFEGVLNINTEQMNDALDASSSGEISSTLEVELGNGTDEATFQQAVTIRDEVLTADGGLPVDNTESLFADSLELALTDNNEVNWVRTTNDFRAHAAVWGDATLSAPLRIEIADDGGGLANPTTDSLAVTVGGVSGRRFALTMRVRGVIEYNTYTGGTAFGAHGYIGGTATSGTDDTWKLTISSPAQTYWLNHDSTGASNEAVVIDDVLTVIADAGATLTLEYDAQGPSFQGNSALLRAPGVAPFPEVFDGHFLDIALDAAQEFPLGEFIQNRWEITGLTGGTAVTLDGIPTEITSGEVIPTNAIVAVVISGSLSHYQLVAGTDAESSPDVIRPDDYDGSTNARVWKLRTISLPTKIAALNALLWTNNTLPIFTGATTVSTVASSSFQAADAELSAIAGLTSAADTFPYFTGSGSAALGTVTSFARTLLDDTTNTAARSTLGVDATGVNLPLAGGTMTGQINFSGTNHAGIKLISLTTTERNALTAANGMMIYNTTTSTVQQYAGGAWSNVSGLTNWADSAGTYSGVSYSKLTPSSGTNVGAVIQPLGTGAFQLQVADGTSAGGNNRGSYAIDLTLRRNNADEVASGQDAIAAGQAAKASGASSIALGSGSRATGSAAVALLGGLASGNSAFAVAGNATAENSVALNQSALASIVGKEALGASGASNGRAQRGSVVITTTTTNATKTELPSVYVLPEGSTQCVKLLVTARRYDATGGNDAWEFTLLCHRDSGGNAVIDAMQQNQLGSTSWVCDVEATSTRIAVSGTGEVGKNIYWAAAFISCEILE
jgi:Head domain of trimeric autotransporter adhesin